jgi:hypothetical protein
VSWCVAACGLDKAETRPRGGRVLVASGSVLTSIAAALLPQLFTLSLFPAVPTGRAGATLAAVFLLARAWDEDPAAPLAFLHRGPVGNDLREMHVSGRQQIWGTVQDEEYPGASNVGIQVDRRC